MSGIINRMDACVHAKFNIGPVKMESYHIMMLIVGVAMMCIGAAFLHVTLNSVTSSHLLYLPAIGLTWGGVIVGIAIVAIFRNSRSQPIDVPVADLPAMNPVVLLEPEVEGQLNCPITQTPFECPWILLEDGFTYEYEAIQRWLADHPNNSPMVGRIPSATLLPNCTVKKGESCCPITREPFREAYYCAEDCHTYEKEAILTWFNTQLQMSLEMETSRIYIRSPAGGSELNSLTLYPNKVLFDGDLPPNQQPIVLRIDEGQVLAEAQSKLKNICIHDEEIRRLLQEYVSQDFLSQKNGSIKEQFNQRRIALGLEVRENEIWGSLDLSHLDLSHMNLDGLPQKGTILKETNLSHSILKDGQFGHCCFINCKMQNTRFANCDFRGERVSFFGSDMENAKWISCSLERASTWRTITNRNGFKAELAARGALNSETVTVVI